MAGEAPPASGDVREPGAPALGFALTLVEGRAVLGLEGRALSPLGRVERLEMEVPNLRFPFDFSGGVARFRGRRCRLRELVLSLSAGEVAAFLRSPRLAEFGIFDPQVTLAGGELRLDAGARVGEREVGFTARARLEPVPPRRARLAFLDVRVYGFLPVPGPMLVAALFASAGASPGTGPASLVGGAVPAGAPLAWLEGATDLQLELVEAVLLELLPGSGWRLPERARVQALDFEAEDGRLTLRYGPEGGAAPPASTLASYDEARRRNAAAEAALARGDVVAAIDAYRRLDPLAAQDAFGAGRLLQLLAAGASTLSEAEALAVAALERWPDFVPALLAQAAAASEAGRRAEAAALYERLASAAAGEGAAGDRAWALVAAARERAEERGAAAAIEALEGAVAVSPGHRGAARALSAALAAEGRWPELLRLVIQRAVDETDPAAKAVLYAEAGFLYLDRTGDPARARDRFEQAVRLAPAGPAGWEGLGRLQQAGGRASLERALALYRERGDRPGQARVLSALAALDEAAGDDAAALGRLREAAGCDDAAPEPLRRAGEIEARRERFAEAGRLLDAALQRTREPEERGRIVRRLADVLGGPLGEPVSARVLLEQALAKRPCDPGLLDELRALLEREGTTAEWEPFVRRAVTEARTTEERHAALARLRDLVRARGDTMGLVKVLAPLAAEPGPERVLAAIELCELAQTSPVPAVEGPAQEAVTALLGDPEAPVPPATRAALAGRLAWFLDKQGDQEGTLAWLRVCLEGEADGAVAVAAWRRFVEIAARRGDATAAAQALVAWADDLRTGESERSRAAHLVAAGEIFRERLGLISDAVALLERAVSLDPLNTNAFTALETIAAGMQDWPRVAEVLERRIEVARSPEQRALLERLAALLGGTLARPADACEAYRRLLDIDPEHAQALLFRARHLWGAEAHEESASHYQRLLELPSLAPEERAEAHLRLGRWARVVGNLTDANRHVDEGLAGEPGAAAPLPVLVDVLEAFGRADELVVRLLEREAGAASDARRELAQVRAAVLERMGRSGEATEVYRTLLTETPDDVVVLQRLAEICRREGRPAELEPLLERLWDLCNRGEPIEAPADIDAEAVGLELAGLVPATRAEEVLRALLARVPQSAQALETLSAVLAARGAHEEADALLIRRGELGEPGPGARRLAERARQRLLAGPGNEEAALELLRHADPAALDPEALALRAELAEKRDDLTDALGIVRTLRAGARALGDPDRQAALDAWLLRLAARPEIPPLEAAALLDEMLAVDPESQEVAEALVGAHGRVEDTGVRNRVYASLLERGVPLSDGTRARMHLALAEGAEKAGDLERAGVEFERALGLESSPAERARQLVGHARVLLARREVEEAMVDVSEALALVPDHAGALALKADVAFRNQDWEEARRCYALLTVSPGAAAALAPELLAFRRAVLAETFGDDAEAEAAYLEVARLNPAHLESREVLAQIALYRGDLPEAARRLEEVLRLLPLQALDKLRETRQRLGEVYFELEDYAAARHYLELVLAEEPDREGALEGLIAVYEHLGLHAEAAELCGRLARVYADPELRAQALYRQGEILRSRLGDLAAANDAYLRASDLDPSFVPTLLRLVHYYWDEGDFTNLTEVGSELLKTRGAETLGQEGVGLMLSLGAAASRRDTNLARAVLHPSALQPEAVAQRLAELVGTLGRRPPEALDPALEILFSVGPAAVGKPLVEALIARVKANPREVGALVALGRVSERRSEVAIARVAYSLLWVIDPEFPVGARLAALGAGGPVRPEALVLGALDHPLARGPLRRVLRVLARPLAGFGRVSSRGRVAGIGLEAASLAVLEDLRARLDAPPFRAVLQTEVSEALVVGTRPVTIALGPRAAELPAAELTFLGARALEDARSGTFVATALAPPALLELLRALALFLGGHPGSGDLDRNVAAWLTDQEHAALLPDDRVQLVVDLEEVLAGASELEAGLPDYLRGCRYTADRVGLVVCGGPLTALRALAATEGDRDAAAFGELVAFLLSPEYRALFS
jgi:tetratricopeptide (TPR) repeat protein